MTPQTFTPAQGPQAAPGPDPLPAFDAAPGFYKWRAALRRWRACPASRHGAPVDDAQAEARKFGARLAFHLSAVPGHVTPEEALGRARVLLASVHLQDFTTRAALRKATGFILRPFRGATLADLLSRHPQGENLTAALGAIIFLAHLAEEAPRREREAAAQLARWDAEAAAVLAWLEPSGRSAERTVPAEGANGGSRSGTGNGSVGRNPRTVNGSVGHSEGAAPLPGPFLALVLEAIGRTVVPQADRSDLAQVAAWQVCQLGETFQGFESVWARSSFASPPVSPADSYPSPHSPEWEPARREVLALLRDAARGERHPEGEGEAEAAAQDTGALAARARLDVARFALAQCWGDALRGIMAEAEPEGGEPSGA